MSYIIYECSLIDKTAVVELGLVNFSNLTILFCCKSHPRSRKNWRSRPLGHRRPTMQIEIVSSILFNYKKVFQNWLLDLNFQNFPKVKHEWMNTKKAPIYLNTWDEWMFWGHFITSLPDKDLYNYFLAFFCFYWS